MILARSFRVKRSPFPVEIEDGDFHQIYCVNT
jgi:hypothetical protein